MIYSPLQNHEEGARDAAWLAGMELYVLLGEARAQISQTVYSSRLQITRNLLNLKFYLEVNK